MPLLLIKAKQLNDIASRHGSNSGFLQYSKDVGASDRFSRLTPFICEKPSYKFPDKVIKQTNSTRANYFVRFLRADSVALTQSELVQLCADLAKKQKNNNYIENQSQEVVRGQRAESADEAAWAGSLNQPNDSRPLLDFNSNYLNSIDLDDFVRVLVKFKAAKLTEENSHSALGCVQAINVISVAPNVPMEFVELDCRKQIKIVSTTLSRLLCGKLSEKDQASYKIQNFSSKQMFSGYLSLDQQKRIYTLLPNF